MSLQYITKYLFEKSEKLLESGGKGLGERWSWMRWEKEAVIEGRKEVRRGREEEVGTT